MCTLYTSGTFQLESAFMMCQTYRKKDTDVQTDPSSETGEDRYDDLNMEEIPIEKDHVTIIYIKRINVA